MTSNPPQCNYEILTPHKKALAYSRTTNVELKIYASAAIIITYLVLVLNHLLNLQYLQYLQKFLQVRL